MSELSLEINLSLKHNASPSFNLTEHSFIMCFLTAAIIFNNSFRKQLTERHKIFDATEANN